MELRGIMLMTGVLALGIATEEHSSLLSVGERAPDFETTLTTGEIIRLSQFAGRKNVVLYFYPKDFTSGCTREACAYRDAYRDIIALDAVLFGVSADSGESHRRFISAQALPFPLISDSSGSLARAYGVIRLWGLLPYPKRVTYVIDKGGVIRLAAHHEFDIGRHVADVFAALNNLEGNGGKAPPTSLR